MPLSGSEFVASLAAAVPETEPLVAEHLLDQEGELLLHLLMADLRRLAVATFEHGEADLLRRLLAVIDAGLGEGNEYVENAVAVSFVEDTGWYDPQMQAFIATWPALCKPRSIGRRAGVRSARHHVRVAAFEAVRPAW